MRHKQWKDVDQKLRLETKGVKLGHVTFMPYQVTTSIIY